MLKKLRIKVVLITMLSVILALTAIMVAVNVSNYATVSRDADKITATIARNGGKLIEDNVQPNGGDVPPEKPSGENFRPEFPNDRRVFNEETPFDTRYFTVLVTETETKTNVDNIAAVTKTDAEEIAKKIVSSGKEKGYYNNYRYLVAEKDGGKLVVFVDMTRQLSPAKSFLTISLIVSAGSILVIFVGMFFGSKRLIKPIAESYEKQKRFVTDAGHELKTPLTVISANNDLIEMETGEQESTGVIRKQVAKLTNMVNNLTALAKMDEAAAKNFTKFDLSTAVEESSEAFEGIYKRDGKVLENNVQKDINLTGDPALINRLLGLLFENASKYSLTKTSVKLFKSGSNTVLTVTNDAQNVEQENLNKCFERFYRSDEARGSKVDGSGIGLSVAKEIVLLHKGKISAEGKKDNDKTLFEIKVVF